MDVSAQVSGTTTQAPPVAFTVAVWLGMSHDDILRGLQDGTIAPPPGAPRNWTPPEWSQSAGAVQATPTNDGAGSTTPVMVQPTAPEQQTSSSVRAIDTFPSLLMTRHSLTSTTRPMNAAWTINRNLAGNSASDSANSASSDTVTAAGPDRATVRGWFTAIDASFADAAFEKVWNGAGLDDDARATALTSYLARTLLGVQPVANNSSATSIAAVTSALTNFLASPAHTAKIVDLAGKDGTELGNLASTDVGYRYAVAHLDSIALTENRGMFAASNANGQLDRFDADTGERNLSDAWIADRAKFLAWKLRTDGGGSTDIVGSQDWKFVDRSVKDSQGNPFSIALTGTESTAPVNQVIFGADTADGEMLKGGAGTDRIYGGAGGDILRGNAGNDYLEGGRGDDLLLGGSGQDTLSGGRGSDDLEGGAGDDTLQGDAGDDTLTGGGGSDRLEGGAGMDTYVVNAGDGNDTIADSDGLGEIIYEDQSLKGTIARLDGRYASADGKQVYTFLGDPQDSGTLNIRFYADATHADGVAAINTLQVKGWKNGDLGITLDNLSASETAQVTSAQVDNSHSPTGVTPLLGSNDSGEGSSGGDQGAQGTGDAGQGDGDAAQGSSDTTGNDGSASVSAGSDAGGAANETSSADAGVSAGESTSAPATTESTSLASSEASAIDGLAADSAVTANAAMIPTLGTGSSVADAGSPSGDMGSTSGDASSPSGDVGSSVSNVGSSSVDAISTLDLNALLGPQVGSDVGASLINADTLHQAVRAFSGVTDAPDVTAAIDHSSSSVGLTLQDVSSAMMDFHDAADGADHGAGLITMPQAPDIAALQTGSAAPNASVAHALAGRRAA